ncbi:MULTISPECIES: glycosyltransferase family 4 protein [unclassified Paludibacterium]|uniref:glycosyltransferase family 4 protein n=1 Tax=unclassified Paludibacterium TaxID=2618429 RepID=UPI00207B4590|nr:glycosyltransferase family 4 protein [Paludibacterium sp. B53371]
MAIVRQRYNPAGGAERFVSRALEVLRRSSGLEVSLLARKWERIDGIRALTVAPFYLGNVWRDWGFARAARRLWRHEGFDLVQSHERIPGCDIYRAGDGVHARWLELRRSTMGFWRRLALKLNPYHHYVCRAERQMFLDPRLKLVICNAEMIKLEIQQRFGLPEARFAVIYNGVDTEAFHPGLAAEFRAAMRTEWQVPADAPVLLYVGSGFERKGVARALAAMAAWPEVYLVVVGTDKHLVRYQREAERLGLAGRVRFCGARQDVRPFYAMADAFVLPTLYDPFPNVCVEALACGLPVLTTPTCGAAELLRRGENGWVAEARDAPAWSALVGEWLQARAAWPDMRTAARESVATLHLSAMAERLLAHYRALLDDLPRGRRPAE